MSGLRHPGPGVVASGEGALDALPRVLDRIGARRVLSVHGRRARRAVAAHLPALDPVETVDAAFGGECSPAEIARLGALARDADAVLGIGGGKALDTAKAVAVEAGVPVVLVPTLASTCSAWSRVSVFYDDDHRHLGHAEHETPTHALLIEPRAVFDSPPEFFVSGIADTLAKWFEVRPLLERGDASVLTAIGRDAARRCRDAVLVHGVTAVYDMRAGRLSDAWRDVMEAAIVSAGIVGAFAGPHGRATAAHPVSDGLSAVDGTRDLLHGVKVAYGILVQLALEAHWNDIDALAGLYADLGLPRSLADLGIDAGDRASLHAIAAVAADERSSLHLLRSGLRASDVVEAMSALERHQLPLPRVALTAAPVPSL